jgi:integrase
MLAVLATPRDQILFLFGIHTGFRISELTSIRIADVLKRGAVADEVTVSRAALKGGTGPFRRRVRCRTVPLHPRLRAMLQTVLLGAPDGAPPNPDAYLFQSRNGINRPISRYRAFEIIKGAAEKCGFPERIACHSLRKTFARAVYERTGHDLTLTQHALGHSSVATTARYVAPSADAVRQAILGGPVWASPFSASSAAAPPIDASAHFRHTQAS